MSIKHVQGLYNGNSCSICVLVVEALRDHQALENQVGYFCYLTGKTVEDHG